MRNELTRALVRLAKTGVTLLVMGELSVASAQRQVQKPIASGGAMGDSLGARISVEVGWCLVGAVGSDVHTLNAGAAYALRFSNGARVESQA